MCSTHMHVLQANNNNNLFQIKIVLYIIYKNNHIYSFNIINNECKTIRNFFFFFGKKVSKTIHN